MRKRKRKHQITCECGAYNFPHRIGGGECNGGAWCESFKEIDSSLCESCNCHNGNNCDVVTGQESFKNGDCYHEELKSEWLKGKYGNLPKSQDQILEIEYNNYYEV